MTNNEFKNTRESLNLTKTAFAVLLGITPMLLGRYESGSCKIPEKIAEAVNKLLFSSNTSSSNTSADEPAVEQQPAAEENEPISEEEMDEGEPLIEEDLCDEESEADAEDSGEDLTTFIKSVRASLNLTQSAFAKLLGVAASTVGMYETGRNRPKEEVLDKIKELAGTSPIASVDDDVAEEKEEPINRGDEEEEISVSDLIKSIRSALDLSRAAFAKLVGVSVSSVGLYETGKGKPRESVLEKIREAAKEASSRGEEEEKKAFQTVDEEETEAVAPVDEKEAEASAQVDEEAKPVPADDEEEAVPSDNKKTKPAVMYIQSVMGGTITPEEVLARLPEGVETVYVKPEDNKAYWVKGEESGSVDLW